MEEFACKLENMLKQKLDYYDELVSVMEDEKRSIIDMDVESLWNACAIKKKIGLNIKKIREEILSFIEQAWPSSGVSVGDLTLLQLTKYISIPEKMRSNIGKIIFDINIKKDELHMLALEHKKYINEYLGVINDVMTTIVGFSQEEHYGITGASHTMGRLNRIINTEV